MQLNARPPIVAAAAALLLAIGSSQTQAAPITWTIQDIDGGAGVGDLGISTNGALIEASNFGGTGVPDVTVNSVLFSGVDFVGGGSPTNLVGLTYDTFQTGAGTSTGGFIDILTDTIGFDSGPSVQTANLTGLVSGNIYETQFILSHTPTNRTLAISDDEGNTAVLKTRNPAQIATGTFVANGTIQPLLFEASTGSQLMNGYQLRDLGLGPPPPPPPVTVAEFDVNSGASPTQDGFLGLVNTGTGTQNGVTLTSTTLDEFRDRGAGGALSGHPLAALLRDFGFENDASTVTFDLDGLTPDTEHELTIFSYDRSGNNGSTVDWYQDAIAGSPLATHVNRSVFPDGADFTLNVSSDGAGQIRLVADIQTGILLFNGMRVAEVQAVIIPEPSTFLIWSLGLLGLAWRARRRRTK